MRGSHALSFDNPHITQEACSTREKKKKKKKKTLDDSDNVSGVLLLFKMTYKARNKISNVVWVYLCVLLIFSGFLLEHLAVGCHSSSFTRISLTILWVIVRWGFFSHPPGSNAWGTTCFHGEWLKEDQRLSERHYHISPAWDPLSAFVEQDRALQRLCCCTVGAPSQSYIHNIWGKI